MKRTVAPIVVLLVLTIIFVTTWIPDAQSKPPIKPPEALACGTEAKPCVVKILPADDVSKISIGTNETSPVYVSVKDDKGWAQKFWTDPNATFSGAVAFFTFLLFIVGGVQGKLIANQIKLGRDEFNATHRPRLRLRTVTVSDLVPDKQVPARIEISNFGDGDAEIVSFGVDIFYRHANPEAPVSYGAAPKPVSRTIMPGQQIILDVLGSNVLTENMILNLHMTDAALCLLGIIGYKDKNGTVRNTSFFRIYHTGYKKFMKAPESDQLSEWEYED